MSFASSSGLDISGCSVSFASCSCTAPDSEAVTVFSSSGAFAVSSSWCSGVGTTGTDCEDSKADHGSSSLSFLVSVGAADAESNAAQSPALTVPGAELNTAQSASFVSFFGSVPSLFGAAGTNSNAPHVSLSVAAGSSCLCASGSVVSTFVSPVSVMSMVLCNTNPCLLL